MGGVDATSPALLDESASATVAITAVSAAVRVPIEYAPMQ
jgi:hypothetical protein